MDMILARDLYARHGLNRKEPRVSTLLFKGLLIRFILSGKLDHLNLSGGISGRTDSWSPSANFANSILNLV